MLEWHYDAWPDLNPGSFVRRRDMSKAEYLPFVMLVLIGRLAFPAFKDV